MSKKSRAENIVEKLMCEISNAIALRSLLEKFAHDERIGEAFDDTIEAHAFNLIEGSLVYTLTMNLMRMCDETEREDIDSFKVLFDMVVSEKDAIQIFKERSDAFEKARKLYLELQSSHQIARTKKLRHEFVAHSAVAKGRTQLPKYVYLYELLSKCQVIVEYLALSVRGHHITYKESQDVWEMYSIKFFNNLVNGQLNAKMP